MTFDPRLTTEFLENWANSIMTDPKYRVKSGAYKGCPKMKAIKLYDELLAEIRARRAA